MPPSITAAIIAAPIGATGGTSRRIAAETSQTPTRTRNQTGKCHAVKARAPPLVSSNFERPWRAKTLTRNRDGTQSRTDHQKRLRMAPPRLQGASRPEILSPGPGDLDRSLGSAYSKEAKGPKDPGGR